VTNPSSTTTQVVHYDFIALAGTATDAAIEELIEDAAGLKALESVQVVGVIRGERAQAKKNRGLRPTAPPTPHMPGVSTPGSVDAGAVGAVPAVETPGMNASTFDLAFFFVLRAFTDLEPFGTNPLYIRFLQGKVAPLLRGFAGADVALAAPFPAVQEHAACLALAAPEETYDWEVREALEGWASGAEAAVGLAIGERQRYRGCVLRFTDQQQTPADLADRRFETALIAGRATRL